MNSTKPQTHQQISFKLGVISVQSFGGGHTHSNIYLKQSQEEH